MLKYVDKNSGLLFATHDLGRLVELQRTALREEVEGIGADRLLNTSPDDLAAYLVEKYSLACPALRREDWSASESEARIDVRHDRSRYFRDESGPRPVPGQKIEIEVPFDGDRELMFARASTFSMSPPRASVRGSSVFVAFEIPSDADRNVMPELERTLAAIDEHLGWVRTDADNFNRSLPAVAAQAVADRRQRILANQGRVAALGIPLKSRDGAPKTYALPDVRRKAVPVLPQAVSLPYEPEPALAMEHYEHVLNVVQNMVQVMERSPSSFAHMGEEAIRDHFLVQLNGHFEGKATGETFNASGKTDILLREGGKNVFIAECKFWKGPKNFHETVGQLLGYAAWRDTRAAILLFNRETSLSTVIAGAKDRTGAHPNFKRWESWRHESGFRCVLHHPGDRNRELVLTVLAFDVPAKAGGNSG